VRLLFIVCFVLITSALAQYTYKKIIMTSCESQKNAIEYLEQFTHQSINKQLLAEKEKYGFDFVVKRVGDYYIVAAEPLENQDTADRILPLVRKLEPEAYVASAYWKTPIDFASLVKKSPKSSAEAKDEKRSPANESGRTEAKGEEDPAIGGTGSEEMTETVDAAPLVSETWVDLKTVPQEEAAAGEDEENTEPVSERAAFADGAYWALIGALLSFVLFQQHRLSGKNSQLRKSEAECEAKTKAKDEFLAKMSHEIRTPMHAIMGFSHLLRETTLSARQNEYLQKVQNSTELLLNIINDILDFSKIEAGKLDIEMVEFDINTMLESVSNLISVKTNQKGLELVFDIDNNVPAKLVGDPLRIQQILTNLMSNSVKFTEKGEISLKVKRLPSEGEEIIVQFEVGDTGIGLTKEQMDKLFKSYQQAASSTSRKYGGTGLGLTISKQLVELMGGEIGVESEYGKGSVFTFYITFASPDTVEQRRYRLPSKALTEKEVLIVEEHDKSAEALMHMLRYYHYRSDVANTEEEALGMLKEKPYDMVFIASEFVSENRKNAIQKYKEHNSTKVVLLESNLDLITTFLNKQLPVDATLHKPFTQQDLLTMITALYIEQKESKQHTYTKADLVQLEGSKILLAEDNKINQGIIFGLLEGSGIEIAVAENGKEAVEYLQKDAAVDLILMDINMPVMDGYEATKAIQSHEKYRDIPIIALTASALNSDVQKIKAAGMQHHLSKPLDVEQFYATLFRYIHTRAQEGESHHAHDIKEELRALLKLENLNAKDGLEMAKGDIDLYKAVLSEFAKLYYDAAEKFETLVRDKQLKEGEKISREIKELSETIGAYALAETVTKLEEAFSLNEKEAFTPLLQTLQKELAGVVYSIEFVV
jgi:two-component system sensor histidine kinase/response regulator